MYINMQDLLRFVTDAVDAGVQSYICSIEPHGDMIKQSDAKRYIEKLGFKPSMLQRWVNANLITPVKPNDARNSAVWYSLSELKKLTTAIRLKNICNND